MVLLLAASALAAGPLPHPRPGTATAKPAPTAPPGDGISDAEMRQAVPLKDYLRRPPPPPSDQFKAVSGALAENKPALDNAKQTSDALARQTGDLQKKLIDSAARFTALENEKLRIDATVTQLVADDTRLSAEFARQRGPLTRLLAVVERVRHDNPPAMAVQPGDALSAARAAMLLGVWLPARYQEAAVLDGRIRLLQRTRSALAARRAEAVVNAAALQQAETELDRLLAVKRTQADAAAARYGVLKTRFDTMASQAVGLQALLQKVAQLRASPSTTADFTVNPAASGGAHAWLQAPVVGSFHTGGIDGVGGAKAPGVTYVSLAGAPVVAPADARVVYAGPFSKVGRVLILELGAGYDAFLAGLDRLDVRSGDAVLAGEPVGAMPKFDHEPRLYFELRQKDGRGISPAPYIAVALRKAR